MYVSYRRGDPLSYLVGMTADMQNLATAKDQKDLGSAALGALVENLTDKTFFKGITDLAMAIEYKSFDRVVQNIAGGFIPSALNAIRQEVDPVYRELPDGYFGVPGALQNRIPGLSSGLEPKRDVLGQPVSIDPSLGPDILSPLAVSTESKDPVRQLFGQDYGLSKGKPKKRLQGKGLPPGGIDLSTKEYSWLVRRQGETANKALTRIARNPKFQAYSTEGQQAIMNWVFDHVRAPLRTELRKAKVRAGAE